MKKIILALSLLAFFGAGCAGGKQAQISSPSMGSADAPVQIVEYFDFQCPTCKAVEESIVPFIIEDYVNTGKAALIFKNMSFIGQESNQAAMAGLCAAEQNKFLEYAKAVFAAQNGENKGIFTGQKLKELAVAENLDTKIFNACFDSQKYRDQIKQETKEAFNAGVIGTPTFVINGQIVQSGSYLAIKRVIDKKIEESMK